MGSEKRKLSDMLGSQWNKEELSRFYKAYRKYGKNWRKVAGAIRSKSAGMVESLYNINKAFLSLPEGQGTADAFLAMMTDRHNILDISGNGQENNDSPKITHKPKKYACEKPRLDIQKGSVRSYHNDLHSHSNPSSHGRRPVIKFKHNGVVLGGIRRHPVGKRTPRIPVECFHDSNNKDAIISPNQEVSRVEVSGSPNRRTSNRMVSPVLPSKKKNGGSDAANTNCMDVGMYVNYSSGGLGNREAGDTGSPSDSRQSNSEGYGRNKYKWNVKFQKERHMSTSCEFNQNTDAREACSGFVEEGELFSLDNLHTLADVALGLSTPTTAELESSVHAMEQRRNLDTAHKSIEPKSTSMNHESDCFQWSDTYGEALSTERNKLSKEKQQNCSLFGNLLRKKRKFSQAEIPNSGNDGGSHPGEVRENEVSHENGKTRCLGQLVPLLKQARLDQSIECISRNTISVNNNMEPTRPVSSVCIGQLVPLPKQACVDETADNISLNRNPGSSMDPARPVSSSIPAKTRNRRKMTRQKELKTSINIGYGGSNKNSSPLDNKADTLQRQLSNCLTSDKLRRWCMFEWFYSAIDFPWFATHEFVNYLKHLRLSNMARLSRAEWSIIRSSLGKPRRFSKTFLLEERKKLEQHRELVRTCYAESPSGAGEGLSCDLARPLSVGQQVIVGNLKTGEIRDGRILTVYHKGFGVQFINSETGTEFVMDVDCMPLNPYLPVDLRNQNVIVNELSKNYSETNNLLASVEHPLTTMINHDKYTVDAIMQERNLFAMPHQPCTAAQIQEKEAVIGVFAEISRALDKKEALVAELRYVNEVFREKSGGNMIDGVEYKKHHAMVLSQLSEVKAQVESGLRYIREHENFRAPWLSSAELSAPDTFEQLRTHDICQAVDIAERSRLKARTMVSASLQTGEVLEASNNPQISSSLKHEPSENGDISSETKELISDFLATCLMIQSCAEEEHAPTVIEETLKQALVSMQPSCPENQPIYQEIQRCMADIKIDLLKRLPSKVAV